MESLLNRVRADKYVVFSRLVSQGHVMVYLPGTHELKTKDRRRNGRGNQWLTIRSASQSIAFAYLRAAYDSLSLDVQQTHPELVLLHLIEARLHASWKVLYTCGLGTRVMRRTELRSQRCSWTRCNSIASKALEQIACVTHTNDCLQTVTPFIDSD